MAARMDFSSSTGTRAAPVPIINKASGAYIHLRIGTALTFNRKFNMGDGLRRLGAFALALGIPAALLCEAKRRGAKLPRAPRDAS